MLRRARLRVWPKAAQPALQQAPQTSGTPSDDKGASLIYRSAFNRCRIQTRSKEQIARSRLSTGALVRAAGKGKAGAPATVHANEILGSVNIYIKCSVLGTTAGPAASGVTFRRLQPRRQLYNELCCSQPFQFGVSQAESATGKCFSTEFECRHHQMARSRCASTVPMPARELPRHFCRRPNHTLRH